MNNANILYLNTTYNGGGAEKITRQLLYGMRRYGYNTHLIAGYGEANRDCSVIYKTGVKACWQTAKGVLANNAPKNCPYTKRCLEKYIRDNNIDILHIHNAHGNYIGINDIAYLSGLCKIVWTLHDMWAITGHCAYAFECEKWRNDGCRGCCDKRSYPAFYYNNIDKKYKEKSTAFSNKNITFVTPSKWLEAICNASYLKNEQIVTIYNGIQTGSFRPLDKAWVREKYGIDKGRYVIMLAAADIGNRYKGFGHVLDALRLIKQKTRYALVVVGNGFEKNMVDEQYQTVSLGYLSTSEEMNEAYNAADIFVLPSLADNLPGVAMEALAGGTPVVTFDTGGIPEIIGDDCGLIVPRGDVNALAKAIESMVADRNALSEKSANGVQRIKDMFTEERMLERYKELYESL